MIAVAPSPIVDPSRRAKSLLAVFPSFHSPALLTPRGTLQYICDTTPVLCPTSHPNFGAQASACSRSLSRYFHDRGPISKLLLGRLQKNHTATHSPFYLM